MSADTVAAKSLREAIALDQRLLAEFVPIIVQISDMVLETFQGGGKLFLMGNGGSAAEAQHVAAEFVWRFRQIRKGLPAIALTTDTSVITSIGNDEGYELLLGFLLERDIGNIPIETKR